MIWKDVSVTEHPFFSLSIELLLPGNVFNKNSMSFLAATIENRDIRKISEKVERGNRISADEALLLYQMAELPLLGVLATKVRSRINGNNAYYNRNFHIEPTNICAYNCAFCSYHKKAGDPQAWEHSIDGMIDIVRRFKGEPVTEVHIVGGAHPQHDLHYYIDLIKRVREERPQLHIKAFSAVEIDLMVKKSGLSLAKGITLLKEAGVGSIPGGGAEIFDEKIRSKICAEKSSPATWLEIHRIAHEQGIPSNATMLYGHIENYSHRVDHLNRLRELQDITGGFNAFIPLKYKSANNSMSALGEVSIVEELRNYAVSRIFLDNIPHIKAYWPMTGREMAQISLWYGADDLDGTIEDTTKIYSMAGAEEKNPSMTVDEIDKLIRQAGFNPIERDSFYRPIKRNNINN